jgi:Tol biopolymer transport system component
MLLASGMLFNPPLRRMVWQSLLAGRPISPESTSISIGPPAGEHLTQSFAISPNGSSLAFITSGATPLDSHLWVRRVNGTAAARPLAETEGAAMPFWSPDSRVIGFFAKGKLKTIDLDTNTVTAIADAPRGRGGSWNKDGIVVFAADINTPIAAVPATGGRVTSVTDLGNAPSHRFPVFLPDGKRFLYLVLREDRDQSEIWWGQLDAMAGGRLLAGSSNALYLDPGYLVFARGSTLFGQAFDASSLRLKGQTFVVNEQVGVYGEDGATGLGAFSVSANGALAIAAISRPVLRLSWFDRDGREVGTTGPPAEYMDFDVSPDGTRVGIIRFDRRKRSSDLVIIDLRTGVVTQVTDDPWPDDGPAWDPVGARLVFESLREGHWRMFVHETGRGTTEQMPMPEFPYVYSWFPDGSSVVAGRLSPENVIDLWKVPFARNFTPSPLVVGPGNKIAGRMSPDGQWLAYVSDERGKREIYLRDLRSQRSVRVSSGGGENCRWRRDGRELFYISGKTLMSVAVRNSPHFDVGQPQRLFEPPLPGNDGLGELGAAADFGVSPDGARFLFAVPIQGVSHGAINIVPFTRMFASSDN